MNLPFGMIALIVIGVLVYFGVAQRLLDRMRLTDKQAILFILAVIAGSFINIPIARDPVDISINVGGGLLPLLLCIYLIVKADETVERVRAFIAAGLVAVATELGSIYLPHEPEEMFMDPKLIYGIAAGLIAYIAGRSRRSAFIGGVLGIIISDIIHVYKLIQAGTPGSSNIGGAGVFDVTIIAGLVAILIAEIVGETREKLQGGPVLGPNRPEGLYEFSKELSNHRKTSKNQADNTLDSKKSSGNHVERDRGDGNE